ncbi:MAG: plasmid recombination protein [Deltaproteobacteria bacterium]|jgi:hypothetical protein|nr:plasmid recombination protein [Deltaproteobacteria bacterium]
MNPMDTEDRDHMRDRPKKSVNLRDIDDRILMEDGDDRGDCVALRVRSIPSLEALRQALDHAYRLSGPCDCASTPALDDRGNPMTSPFHGTPAEVEAKFLALNPRARKAAAVKNPFYRLILECSRYVSKTKIRPFVMSSMDWARREFGPDIVSLVLHMDGEHPHIHLISNAGIDRMESHARYFPWPKTIFDMLKSYHEWMVYLRKMRFDEVDEFMLKGVKHRIGGFNRWLHQDAVLKLR